MKIAVVLPHEAARDSAGIRIRYARLAPFLADQGHALEFITIDTFRADSVFNCDVYLFLKIYDARTAVLARLMRDAGCRVGIDIFDDYFGPGPDPRRIPQRRWFASMRPALDLVLCGGPAMAARLATLAPGVPCHILPDSAPAPDLPLLETQLPQKAARALDRKEIDIAWFGIGDNPLFEVGLSDLFAFGDRLAEVRQAGFSPRLRVLTNRRALDPDGLERISRLPVPTLVEEWSAQREADLLAQSLVCFLPVNGQDFSVTKSLNRGMTALTGGAQVVTAGYPLYRALDPFIYTDFSKLGTDLKAGTLKLRRQTLDPLAALLTRLGDPGTGARGLMEFLQTVPAPRRDRAPRPIATVNGIYSRPEVHKQTQRLNCLSIAGPQTRDKRNYDVFPAPPDATGETELTLSKAAVAWLRPDLASRVEPAPPLATGKPAFRLRLAAEDLPGGLSVDRPLDPPQLRILELARYRQDITWTRAVLNRLFDDPRIVLSEQAVPYYAGSAAEGRA